MTFCYKLPFAWGFLLPMWCPVSRRSEGTTAEGRMSGHPASTFLCEPKQHHWETELTCSMGNTAQQEGPIGLWKWQSCTEWVQRLCPWSLLMIFFSFFSGADSYCRNWSVVHSFKVKLKKTQTGGLFRIHNFQEMGLYDYTKLSFSFAITSCH